MRSSAIRSDDALGSERPVFVTRHAPSRHCSARPPVTHSFAALAFHLAGSSAIEQRGRWTLARGDVLLIPAGEPHRTIEAHASELLGLGFCVPCFADEATLSLLEPFERVRAGGSAVVRIPEHRHEFLLSLFAELESACTRLDLAGIAAQRSLLTLILDEVARASTPEQAGTGDDLIARCLRLIERRCLGSFSLIELASAVGRSPAHVTTALRRATGRTAHAWIVAGRMAEARRRLLHSDERVEIVAERVGYADPSHFIRMFRRHHGSTPAAWRDERRQSA